MRGSQGKMEAIVKALMDAGLVPDEDACVIVYGKATKDDGLELSSTVINWDRDNTVRLLRHVADSIVANNVSLVEVEGITKKEEGNE